MIWSGHVTLITVMMGGKDYCTNRGLEWVGGRC